MEKKGKIWKRILCYPCSILAGYGSRICKVHTPSAGFQTCVFVALLSKPVFLRTRDRRRQQDNKGETSPEKAIHGQHLFIYT
jgi:hypothetical protein